MQNNDHYKEDAADLNEVKRYWIDNGDRENEMRRNKAANSIFGLIAMYDGLNEYLIEMENWWCNTRSIPPLLENFYNGPENSVFLSGIIGYASTTAKKQLQTRIGLMELEQVTQYLNIAGGMSLYGCDNAHIL